MKSLISTLAVMALALAPAAWAGEITYIAGMTGVTWGGCKKSVSSAFGTLPGFKSVLIENGEKAGTQKVTVVTDGSAEITKEQAVASLGDKADRFVVETWEKKACDPWPLSNELIDWLVCPTAFGWRQWGFRFFQDQAVVPLSGGGLPIEEAPGYWFSGGRTRPPRSCIQGNPLIRSVVQP
jgi:hypothetical protein